MHPKPLFIAAALLCSIPLAGEAAPAASPAANASASDVVKFAVDYEGRAKDAAELLRGANRSPTGLETDLFTHDFLASWYDLKAKEAADADAVSAPNSTPGIDNVTNGEEDFLESEDPEGEHGRAVRFKDISDKLNGTMVALTYDKSDNYSSLFFLKMEGGRWKIDDILPRPFSGGQFNPYALHQAGVSPGARRDVVNALDRFIQRKQIQ